MKTALALWVIFCIVDLACFCAADKPIRRSHWQYYLPGGGITAYLASPRLTSCASGGPDSASEGRT